MITKSDILANAGHYTAQELIEFIVNGVVTFDDLFHQTTLPLSASVEQVIKQYQLEVETEAWRTTSATNTLAVVNEFLKYFPNGQYAQKAKQLKARLEETQMAVNPLEDPWEIVDTGSISSLKLYIEQFPNGKYVKEAKRLINNLRREEIIGYDKDALTFTIKNIQADRAVINKDEEIFKTIVSYLKRGKISHQDLIMMIAKDRNLLRASVINMLLEEEHISYKDFSLIGIEKKFIRHLAARRSLQRFDTPIKLEQINKVSTEVYFWGIPSSGKSCALGAILSVAGMGTVAKSMMKDNDCQGYGYMNRLSALFTTSHGNVCTLPESTSIYSTYEMGFDLLDNQNQLHPITCIDLAGELVRCMYKYDANELLSDDEKEALETLTNILVDNRTNNRKIHIFVIEYGAEDRLYEGLNQQTYLDAALRYVNRTGIFKNDTDAVYLMITKVDKAEAPKGQLATFLYDYITNNYSGFFNGLVHICKEAEINEGKVDIIPFSLGKVCFQDYCIFDERPAAYVVNKLLNTTKGIRQSRLHRILRILSE